MTDEIVKRNVDKVKEILSSKKHEERAASGLLTKLKNREKALLIDTSSSMGEQINNETTKWSIMQNILNDIVGFRRFAFSDNCIELREDQKLPKPWSGTAMHAAFNVIKENKINKIILVTDGLPDHAELALKNAEGLKIDIIYIGPKPMPEFLNKLAAQCSGKAVDIDLYKIEGIKLLENQIKGFLNA